MPYVKFASNNYSIEYNISLPIDEENWYEVSEPGIYKLVDGKVQSCSIEEHTTAFVGERKNNIFYDELKTRVARFLTDSDWLVNRHIEQRESYDSTTLDEDEFRSLIQFRQYLRSLTNQYPIDLEEFVFPTYQDHLFKSRYQFNSYIELVEFFEREKQKLSEPFSPEPEIYPTPPGT